MTASPRALGLALLTTASACLSPGRAGPSPFDPTTASLRQDVTELSVVVHNRHWLPMRVWVRWPDRDYFLGDVQPGGSGDFRLPGYLVRRSGALRLYADPTGSIDECLSAPIDVTKGHRIEWDIHRVLASSRARIM